MLKWGLNRVQSAAHGALSLPHLIILSHLCWNTNRFSTLFVSALPPEYVNRVWDLFLYEGMSIVHLRNVALRNFIGIPFLLRVGFAVMTCCRRQILGATSPEVILTYLQHPSPGWLPSTPEGFLSLVNSVKMKDDDIRKNRIKMEAQVKRQTQAQPPRHLPIATNISLLRSWIDLNYIWFSDGPYILCIYLRNIHRYTSGYEE